MHISQVATTQGGTTVSASTNWPLTMPSGTQPRISFRQVLFLRFPTGNAGRIVFDEQTTVLNAQFQPYIYNALSAGAHVAPRSLNVDQGAIIVTLDAPHRITSVGLSASAAINGSSLALHRIDGTAIAEKATISIPVNSSDHTIKLSNDAFMDSTFAVVRTTPIKPSPPLTSTSALTKLQVTSFPSHPRISIASSNLSDATVFWNAPGEVGMGTPAAQGHVTAGAALVGALQTLLDRALTSGSQPHIDIALVIESDAPCLFTITSLAINFRFILEAFPDGAAKRILRFGASLPSKQPLRFEIPAEAIISHATLRLSTSLRSDQHLDSAAGETLLSQSSGIEVNTTHWVAQQLVPSVAAVATGLTLGMLPLEEGSEIVVELREDLDGLPTGKLLASGTLNVGVAGQRAWARLLFAQPLILSAQPYWVMAKMSRNTAIWLADAGNIPALVVEVTPQSGVIRKQWSFEGLVALVQFLTQTPQSEGQGQATLLSIDGLAVHPGERQDQPTVDITTLLQEQLAHHPSSVGASAPIELMFSSNAPGIVTVYPPSIEYDL
jgi:hypothetical protein